jgi:hypothetical protein
LVQSDGEYPAAAATLLVRLLQTVPKYAISNPVNNCLMLTILSPPISNDGSKAITKEAELMCEMEIHGYSTSAMRALAHQIRQAAFNLILYGGSESAAVTAAMVVCVCS